MVQFRQSFMHRKLSRDEMALWYHAQKVARYQSRPLFRDEVCAVVAYSMGGQPPNRAADIYPIFGTFDNPQDENTQKYRARAATMAKEFSEKVDVGLKEYIVKNLVARYRATAFAGITDWKEFPEVAGEHKYWDTGGVLAPYQHVFLHIIATECKDTNGNAVDDRTRYMTARICVMGYKDTVDYRDELPKCLTTEQNGYTTTMARYIEPNRSQYMVNTQQILNEFNRELSERGLEVCIIHELTPEIVRIQNEIWEDPESAQGSSSGQPGPDQSSDLSTPYGILNSPELDRIPQITRDLEAISMTATAPGSSSGQTALSLSSGPRFPHNILKSPSPSQNPPDGQKGKTTEKKARARESDSGSPPEAGISKKKEGKRPRR